MTAGKKRRRGALESDRTGARSVDSGPATGADADAALDYLEAAPSSLEAAPSSLEVATAAGRTKSRKACMYVACCVNRTRKEDLWKKMREDL